MKSKKVSSKKLSLDEVKHVAKLANLELSDEELEIFRPQLSSIVDLIDQLQKLNTESEQMTAQVTGLVNIFREDTIDATRQLTQEQALKNAKKTYNGFFVVPKVLDK